ncbi:MAG: proton-conducting transporter membrane subunit, partial [Solirubrobacteraceae bacterium]
MPPLSILIWLPAACGLLGALIPGGTQTARKWGLPGLLALAGTIVALGLAIAYIVQYGPDSHGLKDVTDIVWIAELGIHYKLGVSGLNVLLVGLTTLLFFAAVLALNLRSTTKDKGDAATGAGPIDRPRLFYFQFMLAESAVLGAFLAQDLALFVAFFDLMLIPFYFLIGAWGEGPDRVKATIKLVIYTLVGSLLMLAAAIATGVLAGEQNGGHITFVLSQLQGLP